MKKIIKSIIAIVAAVFIANLFCVFYQRQAGWIDTPNGPSEAVRKPHDWLLQGMEGYAVSRIDAYGYTNRDLELSDRYVLMMGASHTQGKEVDTAHRYCTLVNDAISSAPDKALAAFNIACDGEFLPQIIKHFETAVEAYPDADCITIEIGNTDYPVEELEKALKQIEKPDLTDAEGLFQKQGFKDRIRNTVKSFFPILSVFKTQWKAARGKAAVSSNAIDKDAYTDVIGRGLKLIRSQYEGPILFVYHPDTLITDEGVEILRSETVNIFSEACMDAGIDFIDVGDAFCEEYEENHTLPYGFFNTTPGKGHLNRTGHRIIADVILAYLKEKDLR